MNPINPSARPAPLPTVSTGCSGSVCGA
jgi:ABC-type uncharacterized transport system fused permease/ATPase subunit